MAAAQNTNAANAQCLPNTAQTQAFNNYLNACRTSQDTARANNFFSQSIANYKATFQELRAQYDDLVVTGDSLSSLQNLTGASSSSTNQQIDAAQKKKDTLTVQLKTLRNQVDASNKSFLEDVMHGTPKPEVAPSLQDLTLLLFWFAWAFFGLLITSVRVFTPGGGWRAGLFAFVIFLLLTLCLYAVLVQVA